MSRNPKNLKKVELFIESIGFEGIGIGRLDGVVHFVKNVVPGDKVIAIQRKKKKAYISCDLLSVVEPSPDRIEAQCRHFDSCGGCSWQNITYSQQLEWKKRHVTDAFKRLGGISPGQIFDTIPSPVEYHYRNKMEFSFSAFRWLTKAEIDSGIEFKHKDFALGLHAPGRFDKVLDIQECWLTPPLWNDLMAFTRELALSFPVAAWNEQEHIGFLRNLILRRSGSTGEMMLILVSALPKSDSEYKFMNEFVEGISQKFPDITSVVHVINGTNNQVAIEAMSILTGKGYFFDKILGLDFKVSPYTFFQTNSELLNGFIGKIIESAKLGSDKIVWDLFCGAGSITLPAALRCKEIFGFEMNSGAVSDAKENAKANNITNANFFTADLNAKEFPLSNDFTDSPDIVITDPPRAGMHKNLIGHLLMLEPEKIVYVSCNPATQARDCALLAEKYDIVSVQPVDMFPQTYHIENIAILERKLND